MDEICQGVLDGFGMPVEWVLSVAVPIFKGKGDIGNRSCHRAVKLLGHGVKVVDRVLVKWLCRIVSVDEMHFAVFILRMMQEEYHDKGNKLYVFC